LKWDNATERLELLDKMKSGTMERRSISLKTLRMSSPKSQKLGLWDPQPRARDLRQVMAEGEQGLEVQILSGKRRQ
jgi:hypothetical protein